MRQNNWCEQLASIGFSTYSEARKQILSDLSDKKVPITSAVFNEASAEAFIRSVAKMVVENSEHSQL